MSKEVKDLLKSCGLDWTVGVEEIKTKSGIILPDHKALIREDTLTPLSIAGKGYEVFQNQELIELMLTLSQKSGLDITRGGYFGNGEKVYVQFKGTDLKLGKDKIEGYLTGINSFDGSTSLAFGPSNLTISCTNAFYSAFRAMQMRVRHTAAMKDRIEDILKSLDIVLKEEKQIFQNIKRLSEHQIGDDNIDDVLRALFDIKPGVDIDDEEKISTRTRNSISRFEVDLNGELKQKGENLWGLFSGVTKYTTHTMGKSGQDNTENKMFGTYGRRERKIFDSLVELVN